ncbi:MAG: MerC domain-containing protein [Novosphingobium sp.]|nr:MerC domain-containing protein [Novosphingobium sp.]
MSADDCHSNPHIISASRGRNWLDGFAVCASATCLVHCLVLPLLLAVLPALASRIDPGESFHVIILALAVPTSAIALIGGWRRHRAIAPMIVGATGLLFMATGVAFAGNETLETVITVPGSLLLASAHIANWRHRHRIRV